MLRPCSLQLRRRQLLFSVFSPLLSFSTTPLRTAPRSQRRICPLSSPLSDHIFARCRRMQSFHRGLTQCKWKEVTFFQNRDIPPRRKNLQSSGLYCKYSLVRGAIYINSRKEMHLLHARTITCADVLNLRKDMQLRVRSTKTFYFFFSFLQEPLASSLIFLFYSHISCMWNLNLCFVDCVI